MTTRLILGFHRASQLEQILQQNCSVKPSFLSANHWYHQTHHFHTVATLETIGVFKSEQIILSLTPFSRAPSS